LRKVNNISKIVAKKHQELYDRIPDFECEEGCTECCGPVPFSKWEKSQILDNRKATSLNCPYSRTGKCEIYENRPLMCRLFGAVEDMQCHRGCGPEKYLTREEAFEILTKYQKMIMEGY
jgi:hypothetical protein